MKSPVGLHFVQFVEIMELCKTRDAIFSFISTQLFWKNYQLHARRVVKSLSQWCHRICLGSLKQFSEESLVSLFAFSLSVLHSAFLTVSSFLCSIVCKIIFLTDIDEESLSGVDFKTNLFFSLNIYHGRVHLPLDTLTWNAGEFFFVGLSLDRQQVLGAVFQMKFEDFYKVRKIGNVFFLSNSLFFCNLV